MQALNSHSQGGGFSAGAPYCDMRHLSDPRLQLHNISEASTTPQKWEICGVMVFRGTAQGGNAQGSATVVYK